MLSLLVTSAARRRLLVRFLTHPGERFYLSQLIRDLEITSSAAQKELARLTRSGLLLTEREGNLRFYSVNTAHPIYGELKSIVYKTEGLGSVLADGLQQVGRSDRFDLWVGGSRHRRCHFRRRPAGDR